MTNSEYFEYRVSAKFIAEIQIFIAVIVLVAGIASALTFGSSWSDSSGHEKDIIVGYVTYSILVIIISVGDIGFGIVLISATKKISFERCQLWRGFVATTLLLFGLMTLAFTVMIKSPIILLGYVPSLIFKPFAIWIVNGFIEELRHLENFPNAGQLPPTKPKLSLENPVQIKATTTVFRRESFPESPSVWTSKITSIPEES